MPIKTTTIIRIEAKKSIKYIGGIVIIAYHYCIDCSHTHTRARVVVPTEEKKKT